MTQDMRAVIVPKSDQLNADSLLTGPITITVSEVSIRPGTEQPVSIHYQNDGGKPWKPCKSMARVMVSCWGPDAKEYVGRSLTLYCDPKVLWGGMAVGGIRISHMSHIDGPATMMLTATKGNRKQFVVQPMKDAPKSTASSADTKRDMPDSVIPDKIDLEALLSQANRAAANGNEALTNHLRYLSKAHQDALRPHATDLRAKASARDQKPTTDAGAEMSIDSKIGLVEAATLGAIRRAADEPKICSQCDTPFGIDVRPSKPGSDECSLCERDRHAVRYR